jgi:hypothetical protein
MLPGLPTRTDVTPEAKNSDTDWAVLDDSGSAHQIFAISDISGRAKFLVMHASVITLLWTWEGLRVWGKAAYLCALALSLITLYASTQGAKCLRLS